LTSLRACAEASEKMGKIDEFGLLSEFWNL
jgi:hypothetical protein